MSTDPLFDRAKELFDHVCDLPAEQRNAFLDQACGSDVELRHELDSLLKHDESICAVVTTAEAGGAVRSLLDVLAGEQQRRPDVSEPSVPPQQIGTYRIIRAIGRGGMGIVYEAEQENPRRRVALKMVRPGCIGRQLSGRLQREAHVLGRLQHPGIGQVYEAGFADVAGEQHPFFAMELVDGLPLDKFIEQRGLCARSRLELVARVCDAVHFAHECGIIHRDLKPGNIHVIADEDQGPRATTVSSLDCGISSSCRTHLKCAGQPKILDFGVARMIDADLQRMTLQTEAGQLVGTLSYMSPEQVGGRSGEFDRRTDIYSLGAILHELLTGKLPHDLRTMPLPLAASVIRDQEPSRLGSVNTLYRGDIETIVGKALEKDPQRRYQTAADMAADIRRFLHDQPILARPTSALYQLGKLARRNKPLVGGLAATMVALLIGMVGTTWFAIGERHARVASLRAAYRASLSAASAALREDDVATAERHLEAAPEAMRGWEWRHLRAGLDESLRSASLAGGSQGLAHRDIARGCAQMWFSNGTPPGQCIYIARHLCNRELRVEARAATTLELLSSWVARGVTQFTGTSADDQIILRTIDGRESLRDARTGAGLGDLESAQYGFPCRLVSPLPTPMSSIPRLCRFAQQLSSEALCLVGPDGKWLLSSVRRQLRLNDVGDPGHVLELPPQPEGIGGAAFSPDGRYAITGANNRTMRCFDVLNQGRLVWERLNAHPDAILAAAFSPDGHLVASGSQDKVLRFWDAATGQPRGAWMGHYEPITAIAFDPSGKRVATISALTIKLWSIPGAQAPMEMWKNDWFASDLSLNPDGSMLAAVGGQNVALWDVSSGVRCGEFSLPHSDCGWQRVRFLPEAHRLVLADEEGRMVLLELLTGHTFEPTGDARDEAASVLGEYELRRLMAGRDDVAALGPELLIEGGKKRVMATKDRSLSIVDAASGRELARLRGHTQPVMCLAVLPGEERLITGSQDRTIRLWDLRTFAEITDLRGHLDTVNALAVSPEGTMFFSASDDYTVRRWDTRPLNTIFAAQDEYNLVAQRLRPRIDALIRQDQDLRLAADHIQADQTLTDREHQIAQQLIITLSARARSDNGTLSGT